ncbi:CubicO group peptidase (beta-lactamase class C family) [Luteimonas cucumeris]|uniref:CubicO group peptidase (Beta-lactamase class C family) n=1 Tax=Luteimonas cucumeris TaxID=985012 RepID=A0A562LAH2_9GAMM|nr:serine hydrolase domain-containing protein [Luteimonas cucumeris]TWI04669.1 CubicO group peptidase (beta-lactamase class C family) [Luteimonas cucumeris]
MNRLIPMLFCTLALFVSACRQESSPAATPTATSATPAKPETLSADTPRTTVDGNGFVGPAGWTIETRGPAVILTPPEGGSHIALVDVAAKNADAAVAQAWKAYDAKARWPLKLATDRPARDGWEQIRGYQYETSANDQRGVGATALRRGERWTVAIYDMANAVGDKRSAQVRLIFDRLLPKGYSRESFAGKTAHKLDAARLEQLRQFVENARQQLEVPGVAIGIVQDGKVLFADGFGVREQGKPDKVDGDTAFMIASNTKAMTTLMLAKLVEQGKFDWDTPVTQLLPDFRLGDADTTRQVLVKHLICACTGLPRQDMEWLFQSEGSTPESVMKTLATMQPTSRFGELFQYSNPMAAAAGFAGGHVMYPDREYGAAYDAAMQSLVFDPLGMASTTFDYDAAMRGEHAMPHGLDVDGKTVRASMDLNYTIVPARPAGAAWSSVNDVLKYVQMELANGLLPDGKRYIAEAPLLERRKQQVALGNDASYGMGLMVDRTWGIPVVHHGGDMLGFHSDMLWLPEHNVGAVILTNSDPGVYIRGPFQRRLLEVLFDGKPEAAENVEASVKRLKEGIAAERKRLTAPADATSSGKLAARYHSAELGDIDVSRKGAATWFDFGGWESEAASRSNDDGSTSFVTVSPGVDGFEFVVADKDGKRSLVLRDAQHEYAFAEAK